MKKEFKDSSQYISSNKEITDCLFQHLDSLIEFYPETIIAISKLNDEVADKLLSNLIKEKPESKNVSMLKKIVGGNAEKTFERGLRLLKIILDDLTPENKEWSSTLISQILTVTKGENDLSYSFEAIEKLFKADNECREVILKASILFLAENPSFKNSEIAGKEEVLDFLTKE